MNPSSPHSKLRIVHLEDKARDRELVAATLAGEGLACEIIPAKNKAEFQAAITERDISLILCDYTVPAYDGAEALREARQWQPEIPFIFVSGTIGEERAVESLRSGATDYVLKEHLERLCPVVRRALHDAEARQYRKQAEARLARSHAEMMAIYDAMPLMICLVNPGHQVESINRTMAEFLAAPQALDTPLHPGGLLNCLNALDDSRGCGFGKSCQICPLRNAVLNTSATGQPCHQVETDMCLTQNGLQRLVHLSISTALVRLEDQPKVLVCLEDITRPKQLEIGRAHV